MAPIPPSRGRLAASCVLSLLALGACGGGGGAPRAASFLVAASSPRSNAASVSTATPVTVTFNTRLEAKSVTPTTLQVFADGSDEPIAGSSALVPDSSELHVRWTHATPLAEDTHYRCVIDPGLRAANGARLAAPLSFRFSTVRDPLLDTLPSQDDLRRLPARMHHGRQAHAAVLLIDGRVLVAGGYTIGLAITASAELFSPATGAFTETATTMGQARAGHTLTRLRDGRVLVCGGYVPAGIGDVATTASAEVYDPVTDTFTAVGDMSVERADHAASLLPDGTVLITGGSRLKGTFLEDHDTAELFDPALGTFRPHECPMLHTRATHGMIDVGNGRYLLGGGSDVDNRVSYFDTTKNAFVDIGAGPADRGRFGAMMARFESGAAILAGGDDAGTVMYIPRGQGQVLNSGSALNVARAYGTATPIGPDRIFVAGGIDFTRGAFLEPTCDLVVESGIGGSRTFATEVRFPEGLAFHTATMLADGRVLFLGGLNDDGTQENLHTAFLLAP